MDPFIDLIQLLRPQATLWRRIDASGRWAVTFQGRDELLFCWMASGGCLFVRPGMGPLMLGLGDFLLVRTPGVFRLASDVGVRGVHSERVFAGPETMSVKLGTGADRAAMLHGGRFVCDAANVDLLTGLLPEVVHVRAGDRSMRRIHALLKMNAAESAAPRPGGDFVIGRLMELILVELLRGDSIGAESPGMLAGLADAVAGPALREMHGDIARAWTVAELARLVGVSRSAFAGRFREVVGVGPIEYLAEWRMARAKDLLQRGGSSVSEIAFAVGFQSVSAFSTAFRRRVGISPKEYRG